MGAKNIKLTKEEQKAAQDLVHKENERIHSLVVKIISWKSGILEGASIESSNKISTREWGDYKRHIFRISKTDSLDRVKEKIKETEMAIKNHGGFK